MNRGLTILRGLPITALTVSNGDGAAFLTVPDPKEVWQAAAAGTSQINIDLGAVQDIDTFFVGFTNAAVGAVVSIHTLGSMGGAKSGTLAGPVAIGLVGADGRRNHSLIQLDATAQARYLRIDLTQPAGSVPLQVGVVMIGSRFIHPYEYKAGRRPIDLSDRAELASGGFGFGAGAIKSSYRFTFPELDDEGVDQLWTIIRKVGNREPVLVIEGGDGAITYDQLHYCVFDRFEAFEREDPQDTRWALAVQDWI